MGKSNATMRMHAAYRLHSFLLPIGICICLRVPGPISQACCADLLGNTLNCHRSLTISTRQAVLSTSFLGSSDFRVAENAGLSSSFALSGGLLSKVDEGADEFSTTLPAGWGVQNLPAHALAAQGGQHGGEGRGAFGRVPRAVQSKPIRSPMASTCHGK